jgi:hypothetical protein
MKTKSLLLATVAACTATSIAFGAVSSNIVGYTQLNLVAGNNLVANTLNAANNGTQTLFASAPDGTVLFNWNGNGYDSQTLSFGSWDGTEVQLSPGKAIFVNVPSAASIYFVGEVVAKSSITVAGGGKFNFISSVLPIAGALDTDLGYTPTEGDTFLAWDATAQTFAPANQFSFGSWSSGSPQIAIGQGFIINTDPSAANNVWSQTLPASN